MTCAELMPIGLLMPRRVGKVSNSQVVAGDKIGIYRRLRTKDTVEDGARSRHSHESCGFHSRASVIIYGHSMQLVELFSVYSCRLVSEAYNEVWFLCCVLLAVYKVRRNKLTVELEGTED